MTSGRRSLGGRLLSLRRDWKVTQGALAAAFDVKAPSISSWENDKAVPGPDRLAAYAQFFATRRSVGKGAARLIPLTQLTAEEESARQHLLAQLEGLSAIVVGDRGAEEGDGGRLGGTFWSFPGEHRITILCTPFSRAQFGMTDSGGLPADAPPVVQYAVNPSHPNSVIGLRNGDLDALLELVGHLRAENPGADVRWMNYDQVSSTDTLTGHLIVLGAADDIERTPFQAPDAPSPTLLFNDFNDRLQLPVRVPDPVGDDREYGFLFVDANGVEYRPEFVELEDGTRLTNAGAPVLVSDLGLVVRRPNPFNPARTATVLKGLFSRGTYGAVRAFTDARFRVQNESFWTENFKQDDFWLLLRVKVAGGFRTVTPSLVPGPGGEPADLLASS
jgi:transcriptional regulator with XRE-family HTH domain